MITSTHRHRLINQSSLPESGVTPSIVHIAPCLFWTRERPELSIKVAATDVQGLHRGPFAYDRSRPLSSHCSAQFDPISASRRYNSNRNASRPELIRSWSDRVSSEGSQGKDFMSKQSGNWNLQESSAGPGSDAGRPATSSVAQFSHHARQTSHTGPSVAAPATSTPPPPRSGIQLPPLSQATSVTSGNLAPPRSVGLPSILNPATEEEQPRGQRRKADQLDSPPSSVASLPPLNTGPQFARFGPTSATTPKLDTSAQTNVQNRPTLTPRSPTFHRSASYQPFPPPTGTISALKSPFPTSPRTRSHTVDTGAHPLPTPPAVARSSYELPAPHGELAAASRRVSGSSTNRLTRAPSSSASPSTSYSSFSQAGGTDDRQRPVGIPISSASGQNVYQMMTLETTSGTVQLPVDVQAASKVADEKRKRNAGASARFRQRRKEKERESSTMISKLEQRLKAASDDADFYKRERDYLAGVLMQVPGGDRHFPRPQSPRHQRSATIAMGTSANTGYLSGPDQYVPRSPDQNRNVRRRTSVHSLPPPPPPPGPMSGAPQNTSGFGGQTYSRTPLAPQSHQYNPAGSTPTMPSPLGGVGGTSATSHLPPPPQPPQHLGPSTLMQAAPQPGPWNPYATSRQPQQPQQSPRTQT